MHGHLPKNSKYAHVREASWYDCILQTTSLLQKMERESIFIVWILLLSPWVEAAGQTGLRRQTTASFTDLNNACKIGTQLQITEAYFTQQENDDLCTYSTSCKPTETEHPASCCIFDLKANICRARLSLQDLNRIYKAVDSGTKATEKMREEFLAEGKVYKIFYICVDGRQNAVNICRGHRDGVLIGSFSSILVIPQRSNHDSSSQTCNKLCTLTPSKDIQIDPIAVLHFNFLLKHDTATESNFVEYQYLFTNGSNSSWMRLDSSYYRMPYLFSPNAMALNLRLHFSDLSTITRLLVSLQGKKFSLSCEVNHEDPRTAWTTHNLPISVTTKLSHSKSAATAQPAGTEASAHQDSYSDEMSGGIPVYSYVIPVVAGVVAFVGVAVFIILRRKRQQNANAQSYPKFPQSAIPMDWTSAHGHVNRQQEDCPAQPATAPPFDVNYDDVRPLPDPVPAAENGNREYRRLNLSVRGVMMREGAASDTYDHVVFQQDEHEYNKVPRSIGKQNIDNI